MRIHRVRFFQLSIIRVPAVVPPITAANYSADQSSAFREQFKPLAQQYRQRLRKVRWGMAGAFLFAALGFILPVLGVEYVAQHLFPFFFFTGIAVFISIGLAWPALSPCPACRNQLEGTIGTFCPECGSPSVQFGRWLQPARCGACRKWLGNNKGRQYKIRACTHCGLMLDEKGL